MIINQHGPKEPQFVPIFMMLEGGNNLFKTAPTLIFSIWCSYGVG